MVLEEDLPGIQHAETGGAVASGYGALEFLRVVSVVPEGRHIGHFHQLRPIRRRSFNQLVQLPGTHVVQQAEAHMVDGEDLRPLRVYQHHADFVVRADPVRQLFQAVVVDVLHDGGCGGANLAAAVALIESEQQRNLTDPGQADDKPHQKRQLDQQLALDAQPPRDIGVPISQPPSLSPFQIGIPLPAAL